MTKCEFCNVNTTATCIIQINKQGGAMFMLQLCPTCADSLKAELMQRVRKVS